MAPPGSPIDIVERRIKSPACYQKTTLMPMMKSAYRLSTPWVFTISHSLIAASADYCSTSAAPHTLSLLREQAPRR